jgi:hypothetical protein
VIWVILDVVAVVGSFIVGYRSGHADGYARGNHEGWGRRMRQEIEEDRQSREMIEDWRRWNEWEEAGVSTFPPPPPESALSPHFPEDSLGLGEPQ